MVLTICFSGCFNGARSEPLVNQGDRLTLTAHWAPYGDSLYKFGERWDTLKILKPVAAQYTYTADELAVFLPPADLNHGGYWRIDEKKQSRFSGILHNIRRVGTVQSRFASPAIDDGTKDIDHSRPGIRLHLLDPVQ